MMIARKIQTVLSHFKYDGRILTSSHLCSDSRSHIIIQNDSVQKLPREFIPSTDYLSFNKYIPSVSGHLPMSEYNVPNERHVSTAYMKVPKNALHCGSGTILTRSNSFKPHYTSARQVSSESVNTFGTIGGMLSETKTVAVMQDTLLWMQSTTGLPWWLTVMVTTILIRAVVTLPLAVHQLSVLAKLEHLQEEVSKILPLLKKQVEFEGTKQNLTQREIRLKYLLAYKKKRNEIIVRDNCHPAKVSILMLVQVPMWITLSFSLRNLAYMAPKYDESAIFTYLDIVQGGIGWIHNLAATDPYYILPISLGLLNMYVLETQVMLRKTPDTTFQKCLTYFLRGISIMMVPIAASVPAILSLYWATSSAFGVVQRFILISPKVRRFVRIPKTPSEHEHPYRTIWMKTKERLGIKEKPEMTVIRK